MNELDIADDVYPVDNISVKKQAFKEFIIKNFMQSITNIENSNISPNKNKLIFNNFLK